MMRIVHAQTEEHYKCIRTLFLQYAESLDFDLGFQHFEDELDKLPGDYAPPHGCLMLAEDSEKWVGCVALRCLEDDICEMKRLYVLPDYRGRGIGKILAQAVIHEARIKGYVKMRLDTVESMHAARALYASLGFYVIESYRYNPIDGASYLELLLQKGR
jgi:ribosomal protein S18 acetylase RimI-like enzyme